jgi:hypothetical protein
MARVTGYTLFAHAAAGVYLADDAFSDQVPGVIGLLDHTHELMPDRPRKTGITANDLDIGITDTRSSDANERLGRGIGYWDIVKCEMSGEESKCFHWVK